jgi:mono/diheme cytochrome c family protein
MNAFEPVSLERSLERWYAWGLAWMAVLLAAFPVYRWREPDLRARAAAEQRESYTALGAALYEQHCNACHGADGSGGGPAPTLRSREFLSAVSDGQLRWLIAGGVPGTAMSGYGIDEGGPLTTQQVEQLVTYLRSWERTAASVPDWRTGARAPAPALRGPGIRVPREQHQQHEGVHAPDADAARALYASSCAVCHGTRGEGGVGPAIATAAYLAAADSGRIHTRIAEGVPGTGMMAWSRAKGGPLTEAQVAALAAWLRRGMP